MSTRAPVIRPSNPGAEIRLGISNFGQVASDKTAVLELEVNGRKIAAATLPALDSFETKTVVLNGTFPCAAGSEFSVRTKLLVSGALQEAFDSRVTAVCNGQ